MKNWLKNYTTQLLENLRKEKCTHLLQRIWSEYVFVITNVKNIVHGLTLLMILTMKKLLEHFTKKNCKKQIKKEKIRYLVLFGSSKYDSFTTELDAS